jgi:hypothetical protein
MSLLAQLYAEIALFLACFLFYNYLVYTATYLRLKRKYPLVQPEGRPDIYYPRTNIPRPIYEDAQRYPKSFKKKRRKKKDLTQTCFPRTFVVFGRRRSKTLPQITHKKKELRETVETQP